MIAANLPISSLLSGSILVVVLVVAGLVWRAMKDK